MINFFAGYMKMRLPTVRAFKDASEEVALDEMVIFGQGVLVD